MINIVCTLSIHKDNYKRPVYNKTWVDILFSSLNKHLETDFKFHCLSNDLDQSQCEYQVIPLKGDHWGWWNKLEMFTPGLFQGPCLNIDIDNVICKDFSDALNHLPQNKILMPVEPYKDIFNSSLIYWDGDFSHIYLNFLNDAEKIKQQYHLPSNSEPSIGDGAYIKNIVQDKLQAFDDYVSPGFFNWKHHKVETNIEDPTFIFFLGEQKPTNNLHLSHVQNNWKIHV